MCIHTHTHTHIISFINYCSHEFHHHLSAFDVAADLVKRDCVSVYLAPFLFFALLVSRISDCFVLAIRCKQIITSSFCCVSEAYVLRCSTKSLSSSQPPPLPPPSPSMYLSTPFTHLLAPENMILERKELLLERLNQCILNK
jgi:hypothetical protein